MGSGVAGEGRGGRRVGAVVGTAAAFVLLACGGTSEGTVVAKADQADYDYACQAGGSVTGPVAVPVWGRARSPSAGSWSSATVTAARPSPV